MKKSFVLTGLAFGDEGKGTTTQWACHVHLAHTVVRTGGPQALHNVLASDGREFAFSQFGSGTLAGVRTHLSENMIVDPHAVLTEGSALMREVGIADVFERLTIDENALAITPFHLVANRLRELARGAKRHGSVGIGVGETVIDGETLGEAAIRIRDCGKPWLCEKLEFIRQLKLKQLASLIEQLRGSSEEADWGIAKLLDPETVEVATREFNTLARMVDLVDDAYLFERLEKPGTVVFEPSQGILLDRWHGFHPHTTKANPKSEAALALLARYGYSGEVIRLGIVRGYSTRHGAGPFVTEDRELAEWIPDSHNKEHDWQGNFRVGQFDAVALRYSIAACGGSGNFDGLVVTCLDRLASLPVWQICNRYRYVGTEEKSTLEKFFVLESGRISGIIVRLNSRDDAQLEHQKKLGELLRDCRPEFIPMEAGDYRGLLEMIQAEARIPIKLTSFGPTERDKREV